MAIQTEVTLQPDYVLSACDGEIPMHCRNCYFITITAYPDGHKSSTILNPSLIFFCPQGSATPYKRQRAGFCTYALFSRMVQRGPIVRINLAVASSKFR